MNTAHRNRAGLIAWVTWYLLMLGTAALGQTLPTSFDYTKRAKDGRLYQLPVQRNAAHSKDTLWLKIRPDGYVASEPALKPWPAKWLPLGERLNFNEQAGTVNVQGLPVDGERIKWRYWLDDRGPLDAVWQLPLPPGKHRVRIEYSSPGYAPQTRTVEFTMPGTAKPPLGGGAIVVPSPKPVSPPPAENRPGETLTIGGVELKNVDERIDRGTYWLQYRPLPGSQRLRYLPRVVLKQYTTSPSVAPEKLDAFSLTDGDLLMWFINRTPAGDYEKLLERGFSHIDSRELYKAGGGDWAVKNNPTRIGRNIPWQQRAHMTMSNNFDWMPEFQQGKNLSPKQLEQLIPWMLGDGVSNYFTDGQPPQWHLQDWEFQFNPNSWPYLAQTYKRTYAGTGRYLQNWMGPSQTGYRFEDYDAWPNLGYYHLTDWQVPNCNYTDGQASSLECWKKRFHADGHNLLQSLDRAERFLSEHPQAMVLSGWMPSYEDGGGGSGPINWDYGKIHPTLAENGPLWHLLGARSTGRPGGLVLWNGAGADSNEPATSEQLAMCGFRRLALLNDIRRGAYQWVKPLITLTGQPERAVAECDGHQHLSSLGYRQVRSGQTVTEPIVRCLVTDGWVVVFAQNPHPNAPAEQTFRVTLPGLGFDDLVTVYNETKRLGTLEYFDREMTIAVARR